MIRSQHGVLWSKLLQQNVGRCMDSLEASFSPLHIPPFLCVGERGEGEVKRSQQGAEEVKERESRAKKELGPVRDDPDESVSLCMGGSGSPPSMHCFTLSINYAAQREARLCE